MKKKEVKDIHIMELPDNAQEVATVPIWEKICLTVREAAEYSNIGINKLYEMINEPSCDFVLFVGKKGLIKRKAFEKYLERKGEI